MSKNAVFPLLMLVLLCTMPALCHAQIDKFKKKINDTKKEVKDTKKDVKEATPIANGTTTESESAAPTTEEGTTSTTKDKAAGKSSSGSKSDVPANENFSHYISRISILIGNYYSAGDRGADACEFSGAGSSIHKHLVKAQTFDRADFDKHIAEAKANGEYAKVEPEVQKIQSALADYDNFIGKSGAVFANFFDDAQGSFVTTPLDKIKELNETADFVNILLHFSPQSQKAQAWMKAVESEKAKYASSMDAAATSEFHKSHFGQVVFSKKAFPITQEAAGEITDKFASGDYIYATVYLGESFKSHMKDTKSSVGLNMRIDGNLALTDDYSRAWCKQDLMDKTYFQFALAPDEAWLAANFQRYVENETKTLGDANTAFGKQGPFEHEVTLEIKFPDLFKVKGKFSLDLSNGASFYADLGKKLEASVQSGVDLPKAGMSNPGLEQQALNICRQKYGSANTYHKAIIASSDWNIERNIATGVITGRSMSFVITFTENDGTCHYDYFTFGQDFNGNGYSNTLKYISAGGGQEIDCSKVK